MFCYQCEQTSKSAGCEIVGVCGKDKNTAALQDLLVYAVKGMANYSTPLHKDGFKTRDYEIFMMEALFTTVTNVNFDVATVRDFVIQAAKLRDELKAEYEKRNLKSELSPAATVEIPSEISAMTLLADNVAIKEAIRLRGADAAGVNELIMYGLKGMAAYAHHAYVLSYEDDSVFAFTAEVLDFTSKSHEMGDLLGMALKVGEINLKVMELLDKANTSSYGNPIPTQCLITAKKGKAILVSGHDLKDLELLLQQTEGKGVNIYTHGEMLPAHGYPELKKYKHLVGNYGGAWQDQLKEFSEFPGAILMTTNCIQKPAESYKAAIFTSGLVQWPGVAHIADHNFAPVIEKALSMPGFAEDEAEKSILVGFGHNAVLGVADKVIDAVKSGAIKHFFLVGGCDGAKSGRNYYTDFAMQAPKDTVVMTLACGKFRFNKLEFGDIGGIPRLLDIGQCNDAYSAIKIAVALAGAFNTDVNSLPLSMILSWYEQKAVCILLTLLHLGIKNIRIGPTLPAFITPNVLAVLVEKFNLMPITTAEADLKAILKN